MDGRAVLIEQSRLGERVAAGTERPERDAPLRQALERCENLRRHRLLHVDAAADEENVERAGLIECQRGRELQPVAGRGRLAVQAHDRPLVHRLPGEQVRHPQRLDRARERDHRVARQGQERKLAAGQCHMPDFTPFLPECDLRGGAPTGRARAGDVRLMAGLCRLKETFATYRFPSLGGALRRSRNRARSSG